MSFMALPQTASVLEQLLVYSATLGDISSDSMNTHPYANELQNYQGHYESLKAELRGIVGRVGDATFHQAAEQVVVAADTIASRGQGSVMRSAAIQSFFSAASVILNGTQVVT